MIHARPFGLRVPRPYLHMLGSSSLTRVFCMCKTGLHPLYVNIELITPNHHLVIAMTNCSNGAYSGRTLIPWNLVRDHLIMLVDLSKIRCIKDRHHMQSKYVTWYGHDHLAPLISVSKVPSWSLSSPAWHHDLHHLDLYQCVITWSSRQLLLLQLLLSHSDKVKQLFGACILCNKETTIRLLPVADNFNKTWSSHTTIYIS